MKASGIKLFRIRGGIHPKANKQATCNKPIEILPLPELLRIPLQQHIGAPAEPAVRRGDTVLKGQLLANSQGTISAPVHAPTSGRIISIGKYPAPHPSGLPVRTITLKPDFDDRWIDIIPPPDPFSMSPDDIATCIAAAGIVGMGGATFPSAVKLGLHKRCTLQTLLINGAECEPYLTCDDRLMQENPGDIIDGIRIMLHGLQVRSALVAIEKNKPVALAAMNKVAAAFPEITIVPVPVRYPMGSEKHLVQTLTGMETPAGALTADIGVIVHNVATAHAIQQAIRFGRPLIQRVVTVTGNAICKPRNLMVPIGTPVSVLLDACGGLTEDPVRLLTGGPMMGQPLPDTRAPIIKGSGGIVALTTVEAANKQAMPCIRCASCVSACPCGLLPLEIAARTRNGDLEGAVNNGLMDCISCGSCAYVCPAHIPLVQYFNYARGAVREQQRARHKQQETKRLAAVRKKRLEWQTKEKREALARRKAEMAAGKARTENESRAAL